MTIVMQAVKRTFAYSGMVLADPDTDMTPVDVAQFYAASFPELTNCEVSDEGIAADGTHRFAFQRVVGTKG